MKLYFITGSCSLCPKIIMNELGISAEFIKVLKKQLDNGNYQTFLENGEPFENISAKAGIPSLQLETGEILTENGIILQYLADSNKAFKLLPPVGNIDRYKCLEWVNYVATELHKTFTSLFYHDSYGTEAGPQFEKNAMMQLNFLNKSIADNEFLNQEFSIADAYLFVVLTWIQFLGRDTLYLKNYPNIKNYYNNLLKRPSIVKALNEEGLKYKPIEN